ncbi:DUF4270 domain-containing protein [Draconibacterium halophilum]|uniref:DUF4270 domain-containing protein n=1 Tax=Draconibacterium halophilum TaxID=2706887 RepID=A0A6C0RJN4_9BACT|nr:DUF4270 domain-containing protein [Draconibacterium halophilum]QIA09803.1 DUF4270 domain-containing protein [Draconibacterium halophilum]
MKFSTARLLKIFGGLFVLVSVLVACNNDVNSLGLDLLPEEDLINVRNISVSDKIESYTFTENGIVTSKGGTNLLGTLNDPIFGKTKANYATQFRLTSFPEFGTNAVVDSVRLYLFYRSVYGDTTTTQQIKVYEMETYLDPDAEYTQDIDLKSMASDVPLAEFDYTPEVELDSASQDTNYQLLTIPLDNALGEKLLNADSLDMINNDIFLQYFKGLYLESADVSGEGSLITLHTAATSSFQGSALLVYYNNDENMNPEEGEEPDTLSQAYLITQYSSRVSEIKHDYTGVPFLDNLDQEDVEDDLIYVQPTGGLKSRITVSGLESWKDSINMGINKAEIIFHVDTVASDIHNYPPPNELLFTFVAPDGEEYRPIDYFFNPTFYGGALDTSDYTYRFNITQHVQRIIDVTDPDDDDFVGNQGFYLTTGRRSDIANRVILKSAKNGGVDMKITYSKFLD